MSISGPYVDGAWMNKSGETVFLCVSCANERELGKENCFMYDEMPLMEYIQCYDCGNTVRDY